MDRTEAILRKLLAALPAPGYDLGILLEVGMYRLEAIPLLQAWLRHAQPLTKELGTLAAKTLAAQFGADSSAADWRRFGRIPGFTNRKPQHRNIQGFYPLARLASHSGQPFPAAEPFRLQLAVLQDKAEQDRTTTRLRFASRPVHFSAPVSLTRFRTLSRYAVRPAAADMAFSIAACAQGWNKSDIAAALTRDYLSRDTSPTRRAAYIQRTVSKAQLWAA